MLDDQKSAPNPCFSYSKNEPSRCGCGTKQQSRASTVSLLCRHLEALLFLFPLAEIGIGLTGFGIIFTCMGIMFLFDKGLIAMGNVSFPLSSPSVAVGGRSQ